jgi:predicted DNA-binding transcriptional regulator AlpA
LLLGKIPEDTGLLIDPQTLADLLSISRSTLYQLQAEQAIPAPIQLGRLKKWRLAEILEWIEADCPPQSVWAHRRRDSVRGRGK